MRCAAWVVTPCLREAKDSAAQCDRRSAGFLLLPCRLCRVRGGFVGIVGIGGAVIRVRNLVIVEVAHEFGGAPLFHDAFQAAPSRFPTPPPAPALPLDAPHDGVYADLLAAPPHILVRL